MSIFDKQLYNWLNIQKQKQVYDFKNCLEIVRKKKYMNANAHETVILYFKT